MVQSSRDRYYTYCMLCFVRHTIKHVLYNAGQGYHRRFGGNVQENRVMRLVKYIVGTILRIVLYRIIFVIFCGILNIGAGPMLYFKYSVLADVARAVF